jgi:hypothetical protein
MILFYGALRTIDLGLEGSHVKQREYSNQLVLPSKEFGPADAACISTM